MPTGYTAKLEDQDITFEEFAMTCARAFGACIMLREEPLDAPIPDEFQPSDYDAKAKRDAEIEVERLSAMSGGERADFGRKEIAEERSRYVKLIEERTAANARYDSMIERVRAWEPPTPDHVHMKEFMLEQLTTSKSSIDYYTSRLAEMDRETPMGRFDSTLAAARENIVYHAKNHAEEVARTKNRTEWVRALRASLSQPAVTK